MLGQQQVSRNKIYLNVKNGQVVQRTPQGEQYFSYVEGRLENIYTKERTFRGENVLYWYIDLRDDSTGELYALGFPYANNVFKSIALQLPTAPGYGIVRIEPYSRNGYDKVQVWAEGVKLDWATKELPPLKEMNVGGRTIKDDSDRMKLITRYVNETLARIGKQAIM